MIHEIRFEIAGKLLEEVQDEAVREIIIKKVAHRCIDELSVESITKLFNIEIIEGSTEELSKAKTRHEYDEVRELMMKNRSLIKGNIVI